MNFEFVGVDTLFAMIGLDVKVNHFDLLLKHLKVSSIYFKIGRVEQFCLKVNSLEQEQVRPSAVFLVLDLPDHAVVLEGIHLMEVVLVSEGKHAVGRGRLKPPRGSLTNTLPEPASEVPGFLLLNIAECELQIVHESDGKPEIDLGVLVVSISIFDLKATKPCLCTASSGTTSMNVSVDEASLPLSESSSDYEEDGGDDSSLDNFLQRLKGRSSAVQTVPQKISSTTQTTQLEERPFKEKVIKVGQSAGREVLAVLAPRDRGAADPAFFLAPPRRTVQLLARPSTVRAAETKRKISPPPRRKSSASGASRPRPLHTPKAEPRKIVVHNLPWY